MAYMQEGYTTSQPHPVLYQPIQYPQFAPIQQPPFEGYYPYGSAEYPDFTQCSLQEEYEEGTENLTRPRLTKEQVDVLEAQFQAHPKPNTVVKRQLATQTKLTMPRVANWFQNRRAKAKQLKKQEEFEVFQSLGSLQEGWQSRSSLPHRPAHTSHTEDIKQIESERTFTEISTTPNPLSINTPAHKTPEEVAEEKRSWESLQRVVHERNRTAQQDQSSMPPPALPRQIQTQMLSAPDQTSSTTPASAFSDWVSVPESTSWSATQPSIEHAQFDFGFDPMQEETSSGSDHTPTGNHDSMPAHSLSMEADWTEILHQPVPLPQPVQLSQLSSTAIQDMAYPSSRRGSTSDELTTNFSSFALAATTSPPVNSFPAPPQRSDSGESVDLATRRKRPRPAALGSAAIRSRSYGALSSMSPTLRANSQMPGPHAVRHVKSTGHSLNARYAGIRKPSSAQRSPLNTGSFADAEAFRRLMAQQTLLERSNEGIGNNTPLMSPEIAINSQVPAQDQHPYLSQEIPHSARFPPASTYYSTFQSPPVTPFRTDYYMASQQQSLMPPVSAGPQYATFPEYTPPYSAGPLTSSSWSDAPLTSPELPTFQLMAHMPSMAYSMTHEMVAGQYPQFMNSPDKPEISPTLSEQKKTEFFIHEFPGQKEEHAHVAQQLAQQKPKNYVFANATPNDY